MKKLFNQIQFINIFVKLFKHKQKWLKTSIKTLYKLTASKKMYLLGFKLIYKMLITEFIFLKEKNESAKEMGYVLIDKKLSEDKLVEKHYKGLYKFDFMDAFTSNINTWNSYFKKFKLINKNINYLEIGSFEGRSSVFVLERLKNAKCTFVDPFSSYDEMFESTGQNNFDQIYNNFSKNIKNFENRCNVFRETSDIFFSKNKLNFDLIYIDGSHFSLDVYNDAINSFKFLNKGGYIIFDDIFFNHFGSMDENVLGGVVKFLKEKKKSVKIKYLSNQLVVRKSKSVK